MRLFRKRKSLAPGQGDATARDIFESASLPSASGAGAPLQAEEQATLADTPAGASERLDGVSKGDVVPRGKGGHATSSDDLLFSSLPLAATTEARPVSSIQARVEDEAATQQPIGRRNSQSKKDRFRLFRSRSSHFRKGTEDGGSKGGAGGSVTTTHKSRLSWPAPRSTTTTSPGPAPEPQARAQRQTPPTGQPGFKTVEEGVSAAYAASPQPPLLAADQQQSPPPPPRKEQKRPNSVIGATTSSVDTSGSSSWRLQSLKRLPSLSLKRRLSRSHKLKPPQVIVTPATVVSFFSLAFHFFLFGFDGTFRRETESEMGGKAERGGGGGPLPTIFAERHSPVHQIRPHILPQIHQPICETGYGRHCRCPPVATRPWPFSSLLPDSPLPGDQLEVCLLRSLSELFTFFGLLLESHSLRKLMPYFRRRRVTLVKLAQVVFSGPRTCNTYMYTASYDPHYHHPFITYLLSVLASLPG